MSTSIGLQIELSDDLYQALRHAATIRDKSEAEVAQEAIETYLLGLLTTDPLIGLFTDEPDIIDAVTADAMLSREQSLWRIVGMEN